MDKQITENPVLGDLFWLYLAKKPKTQPGLSSKVGGEFFLVGECGLECSGEFKGVPVGEKVCPLVGL